jgi:CRISPR-associated protein Cst1
MRDIVFYPGSWYYNASIHGLLHVLAQGLGEKCVEEKLLQTDGSLLLGPEVLHTILGTNASEPILPLVPSTEVPEDMKGLKRIAWWWVLQGTKVRNTQAESWGNRERLDRTVSSFFVGNKGLYVNLLQSREDKAAFLNHWFQIEKDSHGQTLCSFCGQAFTIDQEEKSYHHYLTASISSAISSSPAFPNLFFDGRPTLPICQHCRWPRICFHLVIPAGIFVNAGSFLLNWHLNNLMAESGAYFDHRFSRLMDSVFGERHLRATLGAWGLQGIEVMVRAGTKVTRYLVSDSLARLLLSPEVASLLKSLNDMEVQNIVLSERYSELSTLLYHRSREALKEPYKLTRNQIILRLYGAILNRLKGGIRVNVSNLIDLGKNSPFNLKNEKGEPNNADLNLVYRLLELVRNNQRSEAYHLLLRRYITSEKPFPEDLGRVFACDDPEVFKTGLFSYASGITAKDQN